MQLYQINDPRDNLSKARRKELERFAKKHEVEEIVEGMPAELMRRILRQKGLTDIHLPRRPLGVVHAPISEDPIIPEQVDDVNGTPLDTVDAIDALAAQWESREDLYTEPDRPAEELTYWELWNTCKDLGIPVKRGDNRAALEAKLNGQDPA